MAEVKSIDPAAIEMLEVAQAAGLDTAFDRAERVKPCPIGADGACCKICAMGPCRLVGKVTAGVCGATLATVAARNFARMVAGGQDIEVVMESAKKAVDHVRGGKGPYFIEYLTYRYRGHSMSDKTALYRSKDEERQWQERDPIRIYDYIRQGGYGALHGAGD